MRSIHPDKKNPNASGRQHIADAAYKGRGHGMIEAQQ